jgi:hypothetical protein
VSDKLLNSEISYSMNEAQFVIEQWRKHYNTTAAFIARTSTTGATDNEPISDTARSGHAAERHVRLRGLSEMQTEDDIAYFSWPR